MEKKEVISQIEELRSKLQELMNNTDVPALYECYKMADMNLHWAKWLQGDVEEIFPELEYEIRS